jgi:hypothetical protein
LVDGDFENPRIDIYKIDAELQVADIGTKRITCLETWRSNCILINLSEPNVSATKQRELLSNLRVDTVAKLTARKEQQRIKALERAETCAGPASARGGSPKKHKFAKKKRVKTNMVVYDDPRARSCLCCEEYDTDREPTYPCSDFREVQLWDRSHDQEVDDIQCMPCEPMPGQLCCSCDDDECVDEVTIGPRLEISRTSSGANRSSLRELLMAYLPPQPDGGCNSCDVIGTKAESEDECVALSCSDYNNDVDRVQNSDVEMRYEEKAQHFRGMSTCALEPRWTMRQNRRAHVDDVMEETESTQRHTLINSTDGTQHLGTEDGRDDLCLEDGPRMMVYRRSIGSEGDYDADGDRLPYYWPPFRNGPPEILTPVATKVKLVPCPCPKGRQKRQREVDNYVELSHDPNITVSKSRWARRRSRNCPGRVTNRPPNLGAHIDETIEGDDCDHPFERGMSKVSDCLPCSEQADVETETDEFDRVIIEWCCGNNSMLGQPSTYRSGCKVVRLTIDDDLRAIEGLGKSLNIVKQSPRGKTLLWSSMPCAGNTSTEHAVWG